jgi:hypothetical protein
VEPRASGVQPPSQQVYYLKKRVWSRFLALPSLFFKGFNCFTATIGSESVGLALSHTKEEFSPFTKEGLFYQKLFRTPTANNASCEIKYYWQNNLLQSIIFIFFAKSQLLFVFLGKTTKRAILILC